MSSENSSQWGHLPAWLVAILALGSAVFLGTQKSDKPDETKPSVEARKSESGLNDGETTASRIDPLKTVLSEFFEVQAQDPPSPQKGYRLRPFELKLTEIEPPASTEPKLESLVLKHPDVRYEFLIATVPDPVESKFVWEFDAAVRAIHRAFEARKFTLVASWLPWPHRGAGQDASNAERKPLSRRVPGVLLFRNVEATGTPVLALVMLVGDNPISGIQKLEFSHALEHYYELDQWFSSSRLSGPDWNLKTVPGNAALVVGPYFSGSLLSLNRVLAEGNPHQVKCQVISGSATSLEVRSENDADNYKIPFPPTYGTLRSTVIPNRLVTKAVTAYLRRDRGRTVSTESQFLLPTERVAILFETNTAFGYNFENLFKLDSDTIYLPFPSSISQLKESNGRAKTPIGLSGLPPIDLKEPRLPRSDVAQVNGVYPYDRDAAAFAAAEGLRSITAAIGRAGVRYVGILATDARDVSFLTQRVRKDCPDVRVFTTESSIAYTHPDDAIDLRGMVVGSTYPLYQSADGWAAKRSDFNKQDRRIAFPNQACQGIYNAVLAQFSDGRQYMLGYTPPTFAAEDNSRTDLPPVWISVVGEGGVLMPVHCYTFGSCEPPPPILCSAPPYTPAHLPVVIVPLVFLICQLIAVVLLGVVISILRGNALWTRWLAGRTEAQLKVWIHERTTLAAERKAGPTDKLEPPDPQPGQTTWLWRVVLLLGVLMYALPYTLPLRELLGGRCSRLPSGDLTRTWRHWLCLLLAGLDLVGVFVLFYYLLIFRILNKNPHLGEGQDTTSDTTNRRVPAARGYWILVTGALAALLSTWCWWLSEEAAWRFFLYVRISDAAAGLSPLIPMAFLAMSAILIAWFNLRQADFARRRWLRCPYRQTSWSNVETADGFLNENLRMLSPRGLGARSLLVLIWLGAPFLLVTIWNSFVLPLPSSESWLWDWIMRLVFWLTMVAVAGTLGRFLLLWLGLRDLLREIVRVPMVGAFEQLPDDARRLFINFLHATPPHRFEHLATLAWTLPPTDRDRLLKDLVAEANTEEDPVAKIEKNTDMRSLGFLFGRSVPEVTPEEATIAIPPLDGTSHPMAPTEAALDWLSIRLEKFAHGFLVKVPTSKRWRGQNVNRAFGVNDPKEEPLAGPDLDLLQKEQFIAAYVVVWLGSYFVQLRLLVNAMVFTIPFLLLAAACYPFQPDRPGINIMAGLLAVVVIGLFYVFYETNRDPLVSRISRTTPGRFTPDMSFLWSILTAVAPILLFVAAQVFGLFRFILEPILLLFQ